MTKKVRKLYHMACGDNVFLQAIKDADNDTKPGIFSSPDEKVIFATVYYGWLCALGKYNKSDFE